MTWLALFALVIGAALEVVALRSKRSGDTFSEWVWRLRRWRVARILTAAVLAWLLWHLALEPVRLALFVWWDDGLVLVLGALAGALLSPSTSPGHKG